MTADKQRQPEARDAALHLSWIHTGTASTWTDLQETQNWLSALADLLYLVLCWILKLFFLLTETLWAYCLQQTVNQTPDEFSPL